jgi:hypothetical protein
VGGAPLSAEDVVEEFSAEQIMRSVGEELRTAAAREQAAVLAGEAAPPAAPPVGRLYTGLVEAACKVVVGQRLKGAGMRWCQAGADAVLAVR